MIKSILVLTAFVLVSSCGGLEWGRPAAKYRDCLKNNQADPSKCDKYKEDYESQIDSYRRGAGTHHGEGGMYDK